MLLVSSIILLWCVIIVFSVFFSSCFCFVSYMIVLELLNVSFLLTSYLMFLGGHQMLFIAFMVVATVEATLSLVCLSRVWDLDSAYY